MNSTIKVEKGSRDIPPSHFIFMIRSFSQLLETETEKHESGVFQACDKKWKLCVYPKGNKKGSGDVDNDHISLYLQIVETDSLPRGWEVHAKFTLFVYDQVQDKYFTIQESGGKVRRFHYMKTQWGFDKLLPLSTFNNPSHGYLVDDTCAFGAEVYVVSNATKRECLSIMVKDPINSTYTWKVNSFASIATESIMSDEFFIQGTKWALRLYPKGSSTARGQYVSLYLLLSAVEFANLTPQAIKLHAKYRLRVCNQINTQHHENQVEHVFEDPKVSGYGVHKFMPLKLLESGDEGFLVNDTLIVQIEILLLSKVSEF